MEGRVMGIYIKGFKPQDGLYVIKDRVIRKYKGNGGTVRPYDLVEVKEPHGRLIDAFEDTTFTKNEIRRRLSDLPSAQPEQKKGEWVPYSPEGLRYKCSECESKYDTPWHFCPNCGSYNGGESDDKG